MKYVRIMLLICLFGLGLKSADSFAGFDLNAKYAGEYLEGQSNARLLALGGVGAALAVGPAALTANPARLTPESGRAISLMHVDRFAGMVKVDHLIYVQRGETGGAYGFGILRQGVDNIPITELEDPSSPIGNDNRVRVIDFKTAADYAFLFGYSFSHPLGKVGLTTKLLYRDLAEEYGLGLGLDLGYTKSFDNLHLGLQVRNVLASLVAYSTGNQEAMLSNIRFGGAYEIHADRLMAVVIPVLELELRGESLDDPDAAAIHGGLEYRIRETVSARIGYDENRLTYGAGISLSMLDVDYAFAGHDDLGATHRISVEIRWGR